VDFDTRQMIQEDLLSLYYSRAAERINELKLAAALEKIHAIRGTGQGYTKIALILLSRAVRKLSRKLLALIGKSRHSLENTDDFSEM
jgi:hypothetical protein